MDEEIFQSSSRVMRSFGHAERRLKKTDCDVLSANLPRLMYCRKEKGTCDAASNCDQTLIPQSASNKRNHTTGNKNDRESVKDAFPGPVLRDCLVDYLFRRTSAVANL